MSGKEFVSARGRGSAIAVCVSPGASRTEVVGIDEWRNALHVRVAAEARRGEANEELLRFLSEKLSVPRRALELAGGARSGKKVVTAPLPPEVVRRRLGVA